MMQQLLVALLIQILMHSWSAATLFYSVGVVYEAHGSRIARSVALQGIMSTLLLFLYLCNADDNGASRS